MNRPAHGGNLAWAAALAGCPPGAILDFSASISPLGPPPSAIAAIQTHLNDLRAYPDPDYRELRKALSQFHLPLGEDWILPGNGAAELLTWASWDLSQLPLTYLVAPAFGDYRRALQAFNAKVQECPLLLRKPTASRDGSAIAKFSDFIPASLFPVANAGCGLLLNNPHNPTGILWSRESILPYLEKFALVLVDEAFMDFVPPDQEQSLVPFVLEYPNLVILRSLTKFYSLPGLRLGYAIAHPDRLHRWQQWRDPWPVNVLAAAAGCAVVGDRVFQSQSWEWLPTARSQLFQGLQQLPGLQPYPSAANFLLVESQISSSHLQKVLLERHQILIRDCLSFPELGDHYFRVAVRSTTDNQRLIDAFTEILR